MLMYFPFILSYRHQKEVPIRWRRRQQLSSPRPAAYRRRAPSTTNWAACPACPSCPAGSQTLAPSPRHSPTRDTPKGDKYCPHRRIHCGGTLKQHSPEVHYGVIILRQNVPLISEVTLFHAFLEFPMATVRKNVMDQLPGDCYPTTSHWTMFLYSFLLSQCEQFL